MKPSSSASSVVDIGSSWSRGGDDWLRVPAVDADGGVPTRADTRARGAGTGSRECCAAGPGAARDAFVAGAGEVAGVGGRDARALLLGGVCRFGSGAAAVWPLDERGARVDPPLDGDAATTTPALDGELALPGLDDDRAAPAIDADLTAPALDGLIGGATLSAFFLGGLFRPLSRRSAMPSSFDLNAPFVAR